MQGHKQFVEMLISRLENLVSDHRLAGHCALQLGIRYLLGYEVDEGLPSHLTRLRPAFFQRNLTCRALAW